MDSLGAGVRGMPVLESHSAQQAQQQPYAAPQQQAVPQGITTTEPVRSCFLDLSVCALQGGARAVDSLGAGVRGMTVMESQAAQQAQQQPYAAPQQQAVPQGMSQVPQAQQGLLRSNSYH